jgi:tetratricopeptide (TPR) repeat protein
VREGVLIAVLSVAGAAMAGVPADAPMRAVGQVGPRLEALGRAQQLLDDGDFEATVAALTKVLEQEDLTDDQLAETYRLLVLANLYLGNEEKARDDFEKLLQARPDYELPKGTPPKIRTLYARIKEDIKKRRVRPVTLTLAPLTAAEGNADIDVPARLENLGLGARARLFYRRAGAQSFSSTDFVREKGSRTEFRATIPSFAVPQEETSWELEYYVEIADAAQRRLAGRGDAYNPLPLTIAAKAKGDGPVAGPAAAAWYKNPWVWVGVGIGAAAIATGAVLIATQQQQGTLPIKIQISGTP